MLKKVYYNPNSLGSFGGIDRLYSQVKDKYKRRDVIEFLQNSDTYTLHKPKYKRFKRVNITAKAPMEILQMDLCDMQSYAIYNDNIKYLLIIIDVYSRYLWVKMLTNKMCKYVTDIVEEFMLEKGNIPGYIATDEGGEFTGRYFENMMKKYGIGRYNLHSENKAALAERVIRTLKQRIFRYLTYTKTYRYVDALPKIVSSYNRSSHRGIGGRSPECMFNVTNPESLIQKRHVSDKIKIGSYVRISRNDNIFKKGYTEGWSREIFKVIKISIRNGLYRLQDLNGESVRGGFYRDELQKVNFNPNQYYDIEKIVETRGKGKNKMYLVKWRGYPKEFNSYIKASMVKKIHH